MAATTAASAPRVSISEQVRQARRRRKVAILSVQVLLAIALLIFWEWAAGPRNTPGILIDEFYISRPTLIWDALKRWVSEGILWISIYYTLETTVIGFVIGAGLGLAIGFVLGVNPFLAAVFKPFINAVYSIPRLALVPLFILWFGIGVGSKLAVVVSVVFFLVFFATYTGVKDVDPELLRKMRLMRASWWSLHRKVTLPSATTFIISGLSVSMPYALVAQVTAEMLSSNRGMGYLLIRSSSQFYTPGVFAAITVLMVMGVLLSWGIHWLEGRLLSWKPQAH
jgi:NitT/TauT family transport system permease protein